MKKFIKATIVAWFSALILIASILLLPLMVLAEETIIDPLVVVENLEEPILNLREILIVEMQHGPSGNEFIEIINISSHAINLVDWKLQYQSSTGTTWSTKTLTFKDLNKTSIEAGQVATLISSSHADIISVNDKVLATFNAGLSDSAGKIRIVPASSLDERIGDKLIWGVAVEPDCLIAPSHLESQSLKRFIINDVLDGQLWKDNSVSGLDFFVSSKPTIDSSVIDIYTGDEVVEFCGMPDVVEEDIIDTNTGGNVICNVSVETCSDGSTDNVDSIDSNLELDVEYLPINITELLPDPVSPQKDDYNEYIELYNPNPEPVNLKGYKLKSGNNSNYSFTISEDLILEPYEYKAIFRWYTKLTLANSGSKVTLFDPNGVLIDETESFLKAVGANSWQLYDGKWQWSLSNSPGSKNIQVSKDETVKEEDSSGGSSKSKKAASVTKKTPAKKSTTKKSSTKKEKAEKAETTKKAKDTNSGNPSMAATDNLKTKAVVDGRIVTTMGGLIASYGFYEYRKDLRSTIARLFSRKK
jgi:hypothetical protein